MKVRERGVLPTTAATLARVREVELRECAAGRKILLASISLLEPSLLLPTAPWTSRNHLSAAGSAQSAGSQTLTRKMGATILDKLEWLSALILDCEARE